MELIISNRNIRQQELSGDTEVATHAKISESEIMNETELSWNPLITFL